MVVLKFGALNVWLKPNTSQGEAGHWGFPPNCMALCPWKGGGYGESVSQPFLLLLPYFLSCLMRAVIPLVSGYLSKGIITYVAE